MLSRPAAGTWLILRMIRVRAVDCDCRVHLELINYRIMWRGIFSVVGFKYYTKHESSNFFALASTKFNLTISLHKHYIYLFKHKITWNWKTWRICYTILPSMLHVAHVLFIFNVSIFPCIFYYFINVAYQQKMDWRPRTLRVSQFEKQWYVLLIIGLENTA